ncbi:hypothetical protein Golob_019779, partial [Gossypium lobatum]|nr:hypothetical protein [Gossypium lobatum]
TRVVETDNTTSTCFDVHTGDLGSFVLHYSRVAFMLTIPIVDNNNQQWKSLAKVQGVRCQLVLLLMEMAGSEGVFDKVTFEADVWSRTLRYNRCSFSIPNNGTSQGFPIAFSFLICFHKELLEIPLGFSSTDHLVLMSSPPVSISSPIR